MTRTTISLPEPLHRRLKILAAERGLSMTALVQEVLERGLERERPKPRSIGVGASGYTDTARRAGDERAVPRSWR